MTFSSSSTSPLFGEKIPNDTHTFFSLFIPPQSAPKWSHLSSWKERNREKNTFTVENCRFPARRGREKDISNSFGQARNIKKYIRPDVTLFPLKKAKPLSFGQRNRANLNFPRPKKYLKPRDGQKNYKHLFLCGERQYVRQIRRLSAHALGSNIRSHSSHSVVLLRLLPLGKFEFPPQLPRQFGKPPVQGPLTDKYWNSQNNSP